MYPKNSMDKITDKIAALGPSETYVSLEFFPPKTAMGFSNLRDRLDRMQRVLRPLFVNVTWGAGGSTAQKSLELAEICQRELGLTTCLHLTCTNMSRRVLDKSLEDAKALGIRNILALRGDTPRRQEYRLDEDDDSESEEEFKWAVDLVRYIRRHHGDYFCVGVAAYPEGHAEGSYAEEQSLERDLPFLIDKTKAGADFIMTQLFFDIEAYEEFERTLRNHPSGVFKAMPIIPGLMPIQSYQMIRRTTKLSHAKIPERLMERLDAVKGDDEQVKTVGVDIVSEIVERIKEVKDRTSPGPRGFHFYTLNLEKAVSFIAERTNLIPADDSSSEDGARMVLPVPIPTVLFNGADAGDGEERPVRSHRPSIASDVRNRLVVSGHTPSNPTYETTAEEAVNFEPISTRANTLAISEGEGAIGREATWDDYPNGRWGDARSPAYGEIDGYGVGNHISRAQAIEKWRLPKQKSDISDIFVRYIRGDLSVIPWSEEGMSAESNTIEKELLELNQHGWWTVASQPAVNGARSDDATFGWGPRNGFVFQKAFAEFFLPPDDWKRLLARLTEPDVREQVCFYAANAAGEFVSSDTTGGAGSADGVDPASKTSPSINAVTWGVFPGKEIITPTIIEEVSFRAWSEEAFEIWGNWAATYESRPIDLLVGIRREYWLVNVTHHDYVDQKALWELLMSASRKATSD